MMLAWRGVVLGVQLGVPLLNQGRVSPAAVTCPRPWKVSESSASGRILVLSRSGV